MTNEGDLRKQVLELLDLFKGDIYYVALNSAPSIGREGKARKGQPDIVGWLQTSLSITAFYSEPVCRPFAWELKGPKGRISAPQKADLEWASLRGGQAKYIWSLDEAIEALHELGLGVEDRLA